MYKFEKIILKMFRLFSFSIIFFTIFSSCVSKKQILYFQDINSTDINKIRSFSNILQENDILKIDVTSIETKASIPYNKSPNQLNMSNSIDLMMLNGYLVSKNKTINFPILGEISVEGKTIQNLENDLKKLLKSGGHLLKPNVTIRLLNAKVTILGQVKNPGTFTFTERKISLLQAIGLAGDLTIDGNRKEIIVIRELNGQRTTKIIDLTTSGWLSSPYQNIHPNDVIIVNPNSKIVKSAGIVGNLTNVLSIASILLSTIILIR
jgi:polysaccharide biosynthesis/export protein